MGRTPTERSDDTLSRGGAAGALVSRTFFRLSPASFWTGMDKTRRWSSIEGIPPAIAIDTAQQREKGTRSTVGTMNGDLRLA